MEEIVRYFEAIEKRLAELEAANQAEPEQERKLAELNAKLTEMSALVAALSAKNLQLEAKVAALEARPAQIVEKVVEVAAPVAATVVAEPVIEVAPAAAAVASIAESEEVALDEETGLPELEVEFVDEPEEAPAPAVEEVKEEPAPAPVETIETKAEPVVTLSDAAQTDAVGSVVPKLEDIRKGISIADRFLFQRELFGNNGELMGKTIEALNGMKSLDEAMSYIQKNFSGWNKEGNAYELFVNLLKRRY